jgi:crotonobetainyl-CoA:carnitine CoA-transferase CaiB-like acyl-CoA transferase
VIYGDAKVKVFGSAVHLSGASADAEPRVPLVGEHNEAVYLNWLGLDRHAFESLRESKGI